MCGTCGIIGINSDEAVRNMNAAMAHRGPDDKGLFHEGILSLGHTRLSIIDLSAAGHQPMSNGNNTVWITYNGEIYNFQDLRKELIARGHRFKSNTDTEVIIHLYEEYRERCLGYLRGMFSFAIWDKKENKLFAARDRFGIKPFFYYFKDNTFIFSSELKALMASKLIKKEINLQAARDYFSYGSLQAPCTMFKDVFQLMPAHYLVFKNGLLDIQKYWELDFPKKPWLHKTEKEYISDVRMRLDEAVKIRLVSDAPLGAFLSGGIDSSAIVALAQRHLSKPLKTFSVIFKEKEYDERIFSRNVARAIGTDHYEIVLREKEILIEILQAFECMDQPSIDGFNTFVISKAVKKAGLTVALSGLGGDELFAGYSLFRTLPKVYQLLKLTTALPKNIRDKLFSYLTKSLDSKRILKLYFALLQCNNLGDLESAQRMIFMPGELNALLKGVEGGIKENSMNNFHDKLKESNAVNQLSFVEFNTYLQNTLLQDTDRMSMANSLEVRVPFLDHILVEKIFEIPGNLKIGNDYPKRLLVKATKDLLPEEIYKRPKMGFVFPFETWFKGELKDYCKDRFCLENLKRIPFLDSKKATEIWSDFSKGSRLYNYSSILALLSFVNWHEKIFK